MDISITVTVAVASLEIRWSAVFLSQLADFFFLLTVLTTMARQSQSLS